MLTMKIFESPFFISDIFSKILVTLKYTIEINYLICLFNETCYFKMLVGLFRISVLIYRNTPYMGLLYLATKSMHQYRLSPQKNLPLCLISQSSCLKSKVSVIVSSIIFNILFLFYQDLSQDNPLLNSNADRQK